MSYQIYKALLSKYLKFKSISTDKKYIPEIHKTVKWLKNMFSQYGFKVETIQGKNTNPIVIASYFQSEDMETVLIYGHYDVVIAGNNKWHTDPFELTEKGNRLYARGAVDNKGQSFIHIATVINLIKHNNLAFNIKVMLEGNEETGNDELKEILLKNLDLFKTDHILISDGPLIKKVPTIEASLRSSVDITIKYKTADDNLHGGLYGGAIPNAALEMIGLISKFYDTSNRISIPHFHKGVDEISKEQKRQCELLIENVKDFKNQIGVKALLLENNLNFHSQTGLRPTIVVTGFKSGYAGEGYASTIPNTATVKLNLRLVASQKPDEIINTFKKFVEKNTPKYVEFDLNYYTSGRPIKININTPMFKKTKGLLRKAYRAKPLIRYVGGAIPVVSDFKDVLRIDPMVISLGNEDSNMHGSNENFKIDLIKKGLQFSKLFFRNKKR